MRGSGARDFDQYHDRYPQGQGAMSFTFAERRGEDVARVAGDWILASGVGISA